MKIHIESTDLITTLAGVQCRVWQGITEQGVPCKVFVHRVRPDTTEPMALSQFDAELQEMPSPRGVPLSLIV